MQYGKSSGDARPCWADATICPMIASDALQKLRVAETLVTVSIPLISILNRTAGI